MPYPELRRPDETEPHELQPSEYAKWRGVWYCRTPNGAIGSLRQHEVTEHADNTITVSPSILITAGAGGHAWERYHGYLEAGAWRAV